MNSAEPQSAAVRPRRRFPWRDWKLWTIAAAVIFLTFGAGLCILIRGAREGAIAAQAECHLNQLQWALQCYHQEYGCFPPAYLADDRGVPVHSWRVLILPFIEEQALFDAYRFDEPWNGPNNRKLADRMPKMFHMPSEPASTAMTNVVVIVGPGTAFPGSRSTRMEDFTDGLDNTILLAEIAASDICWLEPRDLRVEEMSFTVNDRRKPAISSSRRRGPYVVLADSIPAHQLAPSLHPETLKALTTIAGGEKMYLGEIADVGLTSLDDGPATDEKIGRVSLDGVHSLWLSRSDITDRTLGYLTTAPALRTLHLRSTRITDDGLRQFQQGPTIEYLDLDLSKTLITDAGLEVVASFVHLVHLNISGTQITDSGLEHLKGLADLQSLDLRDTCVTDEGVNRLQQAMPSCRIDM